MFESLGDSGEFELVVSPASNGSATHGFSSLVRLMLVGMIVRFKC